MYIFNLRKQGYSSAFTIVELLIVIVVIGILSAMVMASFNPGEITKQAHDSTRLSDLKSLNKVIAAYQSNGGASFGTSNTVYISLPDNNANCSSFSLPSLPAGWNYACKPSASYLKSDGTGWVPVDLSNIAGISLKTLPADPLNTANGRYYYSYIAGDGWELNASLESQNGSLAGSADKVSTDGGDEPTRLEVGANLTLSPWSFEFSAFPLAGSNSGMPGWYKFTGTGATSILSDSTSSNYLEVNGYLWFIWQENIPFNPDSTYKMTCKVRQVTDPTVNGKNMYCGWTGVAADGTTLVNMSGLNTYSSQHYHTIWGLSLNAGSGWTNYTGYTKGWGAPGGTNSGCTNSATPCKMHQDVRFIRPLIILNYSAGNGIADIDSMLITKL